MRDPQRYPEVLSVGQAARLVGLSPRTVRKWLDTGLISGYRVPGSKHRRVERKVLLKFAEEYGVPIGMGSEGVGTP